MRKHRKSECVVMTDREACLGACHGMPRAALVGACLCGCRGHYKPRLVACHGLPMWLPWHATGGLGGCPGVAYAGAVACPRALQTEVSGMPWPAYVGAVACPWAPQTEVSGMPWPALVCALACLGGVPRHAMAGLGGRVPWHARGHYKTEVSGMPWGVPWHAMACLGGCHGMPWWVSWHAPVGAMGLPRHAIACLAGCHGLPCWVPWGCQGMPWLALVGAMVGAMACHNAKSRATMHLFIWKRPKLCS
jgi:hypothetical protein